MGSRSRARARAKANQPSPAQSSLARPSGQGAASPAVAPAARAQSQAAHPQTDAGAPGSVQGASGPLPGSVRAAAIIQAIEALGVLVASVIAAVDAVTGKSYHRDSGIAITVIGIATAACLAYVAYGIRSGRRWSRTPAMLTQLFTGIVAIYLIQAPRLDWGIPALLLAIAGFAALLAPASIRLLTPGRAGKP